jgi:hypothetical protein
MALSEEQVVRYSRQILLTAVGGKGQAKLLEAGVLLTGEGAAQATAAAYLAAAGTKVSCRARPVAAEEAGFLLSADDTGRPLAAMVRSALLDANPDALGLAVQVGSLGELPASFSGPAPWVALGWKGHRGAIVFRGTEGCAACFEAEAASLSNGPASASAVLLGALGALAYQRLVLGLSEPLGGLWLEPSGALTTMTGFGCSRHGENAR